MRGGGGQSTVINNQEERWFRPTSQSHRAKIRARRERRTIYSVQAASWRFLAGCPPPSIDYAIVVPGHPLSHPHYRGPTRDQTRQIFVVSEGQLLFLQGELQDRDVPLHDHLLARGWFQTGVAASNRGRDHQVRQVRGRRSPGRRDRIREPRIRREIVPVEEHLSSDGVREPEGRSDREDIEIVGRIVQRHHG